MKLRSEAQLPVFISLRSPFNIDRYNIVKKCFNGSPIPHVGIGYRVPIRNGDADT